jgi:hypothetical protein
MRTTSVSSPKVGGARQHAMPPTASRLESRWKWCYATIRDGRGWAPSIHHHRPLSPIHLLSLYMSFLLYTHSSFMHGNQKTLIFGFHLRGKFLPMFPPVFNNVSSYIFNFFPNFFVFKTHVPISLQLSVREYASALPHRTVDAGGRRINDMATRAISLATIGGPDAYPSQFSSICTSHPASLRASPQASSFMIFSNTWRNPWF